MASRKNSEEPLKAIVFADSCGSEQRLNLAADHPLLNTPILSWQLAALARYGVKEAIVLSSKPVSKIYEDPLQRMKVTPLSSPSWTGEGDALRQVESRDDLRPVDDFILVRCGSVFNIDVSRLVAKHKQRRDIDRNWLITATFRRCAGSSKSGLVIAVDRNTGTLVKYVDRLPEHGLSIDVRAESSGLQHGGVMEICSDVLDVGLDVCAPDFMTEFRENFYYDDVRTYVKEKLEGGEAEVFGNRMYAHFLNSAEAEYGSRITSLASSAQTTSDAMNGWMCPISETHKLEASKQGNGHEHSRKYVIERCYIGDDVDIGIGSTIIESVIGDGVTIGSDTWVSNSIIMDHVAIADRAEIERSIIDSGATVREDSLVPRYCYVDRGAYLGIGCRMLPDYSFVATRDLREFEDDETDESDDTEDEGKRESRQVNGRNPDSQAPSADSQASMGGQNTSLLGANGKGQVVKYFIASQLDNLFVPQNVRKDSFAEDESDEIEDDEDEEDAAEDEYTTSGGGGGINGQINEMSRQLNDVNLSSELIDDDAGRVIKFNKEVFETIELGISESVEVDNTTLEINSLKLAYNCSFAETLTGVAAGIAKVVQSTTTTSALYGAVYAELLRYKTVLCKFNKEAEAHQLQVACGLALALSPDGELLTYTYKVLYDTDILAEEGILGWAAAERKRVEKGATSDALLEHTRLKAFLEWLADSEDEGDD